MLHNLKFGALDRYGLGGADLVAAKPSLVFCNLGAFGAAGPLRDKPGYDPMMQAYSGLMSLLGEDGRPPVRVPASIIDMGAGMWSVIGILSALQERGRTGKGGIVDTSLYETGLAWMSIYLAGYLANRELPARHGSGVDMIVPYQAFAAADGYMMVAAGNDNLFRRLAAVLDRPGLAEDPRFRQQQGPGRQPQGADPDPVRHFRRRSRAPNGRGCSMPRASRTGRSTRWTRSSPMRRPRRSASSRQSRQRTRPGRPAAVVRRDPAGFRESRRRRSAKTMRSSAVSMSASGSAASADGGAGRLRRHGGHAARRRRPADDRQPTAVALSTRQGGRFDRCLTDRAGSMPSRFSASPRPTSIACAAAIDRRNRRDRTTSFTCPTAIPARARGWNAARDARGRPLRFIPISQDEITCQPSCSYAEEFAAAIPRSGIARRGRRADRHLHGALRRGEDDRGAGRTGKGADQSRSTGYGPGWRPLPAPRQRPDPAVARGPACGRKHYPLLTRDERHPRRGFAAGPTPERSPRAAAASAPAVPARTGRSARRSRGPR